MRTGKNAEGKNEGQTEKQTEGETEKRRKRQRQKNRKKDKEKDRNTDKEYRKSDCKSGKREATRKPFCTFGISHDGRQPPTFSRVHEQKYDVVLVNQLIQSPHIIHDLFGHFGRDRVSRHGNGQLDRFRLSAGENESHGIGGGARFGLAAIQTVGEGEQTLTHRIRKGHFPAVQKRDVSQTPTCDLTQDMQCIALNNDIGNILKYHNQYLNLRSKRSGKQIKAKQTFSIFHCSVCRTHAYTRRIFLLYFFIFVTNNSVYAIKFGLSLHRLFHATKATP